MFDLEGVLERWFTMKNNRDLDAILHSLKQQVSWKTAARASVLAEYSDLFGLLTALTPQGVLPAKKLALAICACHQRRPVNFSAKDLSTFSDDASGLIRACFAKFRDLAIDPDARRRCFAKASEVEKQKIEEVIESMIVEVAITYTAPPACSTLVCLSAAAAQTPQKPGMSFGDFESVGNFFANFGSTMDQTCGSADTPRMTRTCSNASIPSTVGYSADGQVRGTCDDCLLTSKRYITHMVMGTSCLHPSVLPVAFGPRSFNLARGYPRKQINSLSLARDLPKNET